MKHYNKLVRDKIPEIITKNGKSPVCHTLSNSQAIVALIDKLNEETEEFRASQSIDELADLLTIINCLAVKLNYRKIDVIKAEKKKTEERGGFNDNIYLEYVK